MTWWRRRGARLGALAVGAALVPLALGGCQALSTQVTSVVGIYEPGNPMIDGGGLPAELVTFTVPDFSEDLICLVEIVDDSGQIIGSTVSTTGAGTGGSGTESVNVPVQIPGPIFNGTPSNAIVHCGVK